jgi:nonribosomal peptide synthetase DhbF
VADPARRAEQSVDLFHSYSFDFSVWEMWGCLLSGDRHVLVDYETVVGPVEFAVLLAAERVTVLNLVPSTFRVAAEYVAAAGIELPRLRYLVFGGEAIDTEAINRWHRSAVAHTTLFTLPRAQARILFVIADLPVAMNR